MSRFLYRNLELLEPYEGKLSCTVLRGESSRKEADLPDQLATAEQYDRFISCLDKAVVYKAHTPKSYYAAIGNALPIKSYCGLTIFVPQESLPKMLEWYKQRVGWYKAVYE